MRLALLIGARPSVLKNGPRVALPSGDWNIESNLSGTKVRLLYDTPVTTEAGKGYIKNVLEYDNSRPAKLTGPCIVEVEAMSEHIGKEPHISIYAERVTK